MEIRQLECFVAVAEHAHFGRAAASVGMGQPALSQQVRRLEKQMELRLFERSSRRVVPTAAGEAFLPLARDVLATHARARSFRVPDGQQLRIAVAGGLGLALADAVAHCRRRRRDLRVELVHEPEVRRAALVHQGVVDAALVRRTSKGQDTLVRTVLGPERLWVALPEDLVTSRRQRRVGREQLAQLPARLLDEDPDPELAAVVTQSQAEGRWGIGEACAAWAGGERSWAPLHPLHAAHLARARIPDVAVAVVEPRLAGNLVLVTRKPPTGALAELAGRLRDALAQADQD